MDAGSRCASLSLVISNLNDVQWISMDHHHHYASSSMIRLMAFVKFISPSEEKICIANASVFCLFSVFFFSWFAFSPADVPTLSIPVNHRRSSYGMRSTPLPAGASNASVCFAATGCVILIILLQQDSLICQSSFACPCFAIHTVHQIAGVMHDGSSFAFSRFISRETKMAMLS